MIRAYVTIKITAGRGAVIEERPPVFFEFEHEPQIGDILTRARIDGCGPTRVTERELGGPGDNLVLRCAAVRIATVEEPEVGPRREVRK